MIKLNVNVDHFATLRNARGEKNPDIVFVAQKAELAGAAGIVAHLRKDRRHIKDDDVINLKDNIATHLNLEMCVDIVDFACKVQPTVATLVPENDNEITTEGGLDVVNSKNVEGVIKQLQDAGIIVSLFIEPDIKQLEKAIQFGTNRVEFNTNLFAIAFKENNLVKVKEEMERIENASKIAVENNIYVAAGHSLNYNNIDEFAKNMLVKEYNIGHSIVARSVIVGLHNAVKEMIDIIYKSRTFFIKTLNFLNKR
ncbi:MAG: pyridoxine 5'-phosphate synthase [Bacteroidetes bacterium]|nr:pyridoxine 5'-phosphate synthase [Bacteroidota bacterium]